MLEASNIFHQITLNAKKAVLLPEQKTMLLDLVRTADAWTFYFVAATYVTNTLFVLILLFYTSSTKQVYAFITIHYSWFVVDVYCCVISIIIFSYYYS